VILQHIKIYQVLHQILFHIKFSYPHFANSMANVLQYILQYIILLRNSIMELKHFYYLFIITTII